MTFRKPLTPALLALTLATAVLFPATASAKPAPKPVAHPSRAKLKPCKVPGQKGKVAARCGLSRSGRTGRRSRAARSA